MAMSKHTPGPFEVQNPVGSDVGLWVVQAGLKAHEWSCIAIVPRDEDRDGKHFITKAEQKANADLFAAAPEMLVMLRECRATLAFAAGDGDDQANQFIAEIDAVMDKAEGRS